jgi:DNA-binding LacI/PurR family transcriptional regulator/predicted transcriptional regulator
MANLKSKPKYELILDALINRIASDFKEDDLFYSQRDLMKDFNVSYITISRVLKELKSKGIVYTQKGKGIYIKKIPSLTISRIPKLLVFVDLNSPRNSDIVKEYLKGLISGQEKGYFDIVYSLPDSNVDKMLDILAKSSAEGVILLEDKLYTLLERLYNDKIPHIAIHPIHRKHDFCVDTDDNYAIRQAIIKLVQSGRKRILLIGRDIRIGHNIDKFEAYSQALEVMDVPYNKKRIIDFPGQSDFSTQINFILEGMRSNLNDFDAIVVIDPRTLELVEFVIKTENIDLDKIDIVVFGDYAHTKLTHLPLSCVIDPRYSEAVEIGGKMLAERCVHNSAKPEIKLLKPFVNWIKQEG